MSLVVQKFGGTSVATAEQIHRAARRAIREKLAGRRVVTVVSAMGDTTDRLIRLAREICDAPPRRELDMLVTTGEQVSIALMAMAIHAAGHEAISLTAAQVGLVTDSAHTKARIHSISAERINRELDAGRIVIVAGFQGIDPAGEITALGRGASDTTAVALAAVLDAEVCEIYTDVDGVYTADPRLVPEAHKIDRISYDEMLELASLGAVVVHSRGIEFGTKYQVPIHVRSSMTDSKGTMIVPETPGMEDIVVRGVTLRRDLARILINNVPNRPGLAFEIFDRIAQHHIVVDDIIQNVVNGGSEVDIDFTVELDDASETKAVCEKLASEMNVGTVVADDQVSKVSIVGVGMRSHTGVAARMFRALAAAGVNIENISTSEIVISVIVRREDGEKALRALHSAFELDKGP
ncbi:MAG: aspartate kinase [Phycisphaerales bacterium]|nr:MAG: aspartate kinase [Phycisphaerales bacterium]